MAVIKVVLKPTSSSDNDIIITNGKYDAKGVTLTTLSDLQSLSQSTSDASTINYGVLANSGSITVIDRDGKIASLIEDGTLPASNVPVEIYVNDNLIQKHITSDSTYKTSSKELTISLTNSLESMDTLTYSGYSYTGETATLYEILEDVITSYYGGSIPSSWTFSKMVSEESVFYSGSLNQLMTVGEYLQTINITYPNIESGSTYRTVIDEICSLAQLNMYMNEDDNIVFSNARPIKTGSETILNFKYRILNSEPDMSLFVKNKYDNVSFNITAYSWENATITDTQTIEFNSFTSSGAWTDKTSDVPSKYNYSQTVEEFDNGSQRWYGEMTITFDFDEIWLQNCQLSYTVNYYDASSKTTTTTEEVYDLPAVSSAPSSMKPATTSSGKYTPIYYVSYNNFKKKITLHLSAWIGGALTGSTANYEYLTTMNVALVADRLTSSSISKTIGSGDNPVEFSQNSLLQSSTNYGRVANNIINDYESGIKTLSVSINPNNISDTNGNQIKDFSIGDIVNVGDFVSIPNVNYSDGTSIQWKVTGRQFNYDGEPTVDVELMETGYAYEWYWEAITWDSLTPTYGNHVWTDGTNIYYSYNSNQYIFNTSTSTWATKTWSGLTSFAGSGIWTDGTNIYYSSGSTQYVLDVETSTWSTKTWSGLTSFGGDDIWTDGTNIYYSYSSSQYILNVSTSTWETKTWYGYTSFDGEYVWTDGINIYYSSSVTQYVLNVKTSTWTKKVWNGDTTQISGSSVWTDGFDFYYGPYVLDSATSTWSTKVWAGGMAIWYGNRTWTDGTNFYYSYSSNQYILKRRNATLE